MPGPGSRRRRRRIDPLKLLRSLVSGILMTIGIFLIFVAFGELVVLLFDLRTGEVSSYQDWWSTPLMMVIGSLPFFLGYFLINLSKYKFYHRIVNSIKVPPALRRPDDLDEIDID